MMKDQMGWACGMYGGEMHTKWENVKGGGHLEDLGVDGRMMITTWILDFKLSPCFDCSFFSFG